MAEDDDPRCVARITSIIAIALMLMFANYRWVIPLKHGLSIMQMEFCVFFGIMAVLSWRQELS